MKVCLINFHCLVDFEFPETYEDKLLHVKGISMNADDFLDFLSLAEIHTTNRLGDNNG
jgi:hypothetical protein